MQQLCRIRIKIPTDFELQIRELEVTGIFRPKSLSPRLTSSDYELRDGTSEDSRKSLVFTGCFDSSALGNDPQGRVFIKQIRTQKFVKDSG